MKIIDELIIISDKNNSNNSDKEAHKEDMNTGLLSCADQSTNIKQESSIGPNIEAYVPDNNSHIHVDHDNSIPDKKFGFLHHDPPNIKFIGKDRESGILQFHFLYILKSALLVQY